jgi:hypothetical protein
LIAVYFIVAVVHGVKLPIQAQRSDPPAEGASFDCGRGARR